MWYFIEILNYLWLLSNCVKFCPFRFVVKTTCAHTSSSELKFYSRLRPTFAVNTWKLKNLNKTELEMNSKNGLKWAMFLWRSWRKWANHSVLAPRADCRRVTGWRSVGCGVCRSTGSLWANTGGGGGGGEEWTRPLANVAGRRAGLIILLPCLYLILSVLNSSSYPSSK